MICSSLLPGLVTGEVNNSRDPETGLSTWIWSDRGISVQLKQLLPDQTRAFFLGRGFSTDVADHIGRSCVFQTIFRNDGTRVVEYDLSDWSILHSSERLPLKTRAVWGREWATLGIDESARIAFRWSLLPTAQRFEPGDYNWGMTSFGLPPGACFDLSLIVRIGGEPVSAEIPSLVCSDDLRPEDLP